MLGTSPHRCMYASRVGNVKLVNGYPAITGYPTDETDSHFPSVKFQKSLREANPMWPHMTKGDWRSAYSVTIEKPDCETVKESNIWAPEVSIADR